MLKVRQKFKIMLLPLILGCCTFQSNGMFPGPFFADNFPPPGPPNYQQGMVDGCKTAISAVGNALYGLMYNGIYYDVDKALNDRVYYSAWKDGYLYCKFEHDKGPE